MKEKRLPKHKHEWVSNFHWNGGPSKHPITQCRGCGKTWKEVRLGERKP